ncbi:MAG: putative bifunctional diguanylate cyclase/phosphodiesterase [Acidimicrobiales bacterium]
MTQDGDDYRAVMKSWTFDAPGQSRLLDQLPDAVVVVDPELRVVWGNEAAAVLVGGSLDDWLGRSAAALVHPDDLEFALTSVDTVQKKVVGTPIELRLRTESGWRLVEVLGAPLYGPSDGSDPAGASPVVMCIRDLTERRRWEIAGDETAMFRSLVQNGAALTMLVRADGIVHSASAALTRDLGQDPEQVEGCPLAWLVHPDDRSALTAAIARAAAEPTGSTSSAASSGEAGGRPSALGSKGATVVVEVRFHRAQRDDVPFELTITNLLDDPTVAGLVISGHDITRLRAAQEAIEELAMRDALTSLPNRACLDRRIGEGLERLRERGEPMVVAFLDLDRFKPINDLFGHDAGDELLQILARRLRGVVADSDMVARFGGDEFVVVTHVPADQVPGLIDRLEDTVAQPFALAKGSAQVFASVGYAVATGAHSAESLLAEADGRMYAIKRSRRGHLAETVTSIEDRRQVAKELSVALTRDELQAHYQPIVDLLTGKVVGYEALVRWQHPRRGLLLPEAFLGVAENSGRELELGEVVLRAACTHLADLDRLGGEPVWMSVNASVGQLAGKSFVDLVASVLSEHGISPHRMCIEITERSVLERPAHGPSTPVRMTLDGLADLGVRLAIDDFGTGYSSLTHLLQFPVQVLKIDRSFVQGVATDRQSRALVAAVVRLATGMGLTAVAEGVEEPVQADVLRELGCPFGQGYLFGRPAPAASFWATATSECGSDLPGACWAGVPPDLGDLRPEPVGRSRIVPVPLGVRVVTAPTQQS